VTKSNVQRASLPLLAMSDRELLLLLRDAAEGDGFASARDVADRLSLEGEEPHRAVAQRLSWLKRYGAVEREHERDEHGNIRYTRGGKIMYTQRWELTELGLTIATGKLTAAQQRQLEGMETGHLVMATRFLSRRVKESGEQTGKLLQREYRYGIGR
jgi:hypothetical protein